MKQLLEQMQRNLDAGSLETVLTTCDAICKNAGLMDQSGAGLTNYSKPGIADDPTVIETFSRAYLQSVASLMDSNWYDDDEYPIAQLDFGFALSCISRLTGTSPELLMIRLMNEWGRCELHKKPNTCGE